MKIIIYYLEHLLFRLFDELFGRKLKLCEVCTTENIVLYSTKIVLEFNQRQLSKS